MSNLAAKPPTRAIIMEELLPHAPEVVWRVLTTPDLIARWLMKNDFAAEVGHRFTMQARPMGDRRRQGPQSVRRRRRRRRA